MGFFKAPEQVARDLDGRVVLGWGWGPPGDLCSQHEEGWVWRKERRRETGKVFEGAETMAYSLLPPGLKIGWSGLEASPALS